MDRWRFFKHEAFIVTGWWFLVPCVIVAGWNARYCKPNFSIEFHFLCFHFRLMFIKDESYTKEKK